MANFLKKYLIPLKQDFWLFTVLSIPGLVFYFIGLSQLDAFNFTTITLGAIYKFCCEFMTVAIIFYLLHFIGVKRMWLFALVFFFYYVTITADIVLLFYFRERFSIKYLMTLGGAQYQFLTDIRMLLYLSILYIFPYFSIKKLWHKTSFKQSTKKLAVVAVLLLILSFLSPLKYLNTPKTFFANMLMDTTVINISKEAVSKKYPYEVVQNIAPELAQEAQKYGLFRETNFVNQNTYERIILITTEALSNKFISSFNPNIPPQASSIYDGLLHYYPSASLKPVTLSTLYGLSVIFSGHPNAELIFKTQYPLSFVNILKDNGFTTTFIRGANEEYMDEHIRFKEAGFKEIYGAAYFERLAPYSSSVAWWGLTDRKLFDFTIEYLKAHRNEKIFIDILNVDTHVPSGRGDYLGQEYPDILSPDDNVQKLYTRPNMPRAFARHNYDLGQFLRNIQEEGLFDDKTLIIITADHPFFANVDGGNLFDNYRPVYDEVPIIFISKKPILEKINSDLFKSQQDIAPTILGLAGLKTPRGMFGRSIFDNNTHTVFNLKDGYTIVKNTNGTIIIPFNSSSKENKNLLKLLNTALVD